MKYFKIISVTNMTLHEQKFKTELFENFIQLNYFLKQWPALTEAAFYHKLKISPCINLSL